MRLETGNSMAMTLPDRARPAPPALFRDRREAGRLLAQKLAPHAPENPLVLALPRGGLPVGVEIARALDAPLDLLLARKIGTSWQPELAIGAVIGGPHPRTVINRDIAGIAGVTDADLARIAKIQFEELERRRHLWLGRRHPLSPSGRSVILVDDGIATGATMRVALEALRAENPLRLILASPIAPEETARMLRALCDEAVFLETPRDFSAVGAFYRDFRQLRDGEVRSLLNSVRKH
jgi:predicted phosphoribosyltransferase